MGWRTSFYVHSNPKNRVISPVNALWMYLLKISWSSWWVVIFPGTFHYNRYTKVINDMIKEHEYDLSSYGKAEKVFLCLESKFSPILQQFYWGLDI